MSKKALYKNKRTGDLFAIETDEAGKVLSTSGPLLTKDINSEQLDYDNYWNSDINANIEGFELLSEAEYKDLLKQTGFFIQESQRSIFSELKKKKQVPILRVNSQFFSLSDSQTGKFGVTKTELQMIILLLLNKNRSGRCSQRILFNKLLSHLRIRASGDTRDKLMKIYLENLQDLKANSKVEFVSGKTRLNIRLIKT